jgi:hypothetical protein
LFSSAISWCAAAESGSAAEEVAERNHVRVLPPQFAREARLRDHPGARAGQRADAAGVVEVRVCQDHVADLVGAQAGGGQSGADAALGRSGVDRHHAVLGADESEVAKVVALRHADVRRDLHDPGRAEVEAVGGVRPAAPELQPGPGRSRGQAGVRHGLGRQFVPAGGGVGRGQRVVDGTDHHAGELVADGEHELQVGDGLLGVPGLGRQRREREAAIVLRRPEVPASGVVQPGQARWDVLADADLEVPGQGQRQHLVGLAGRECLEVGEPVAVGPGRGEHRSQGDERRPVCAGPAGRHLERLDVVILDDLLVCFHS